MTRRLGSRELNRSVPVSPDSYLKIIESGLLSDVKQKTPSWANFFHFHAAFGKDLKVIGWHPAFGIGALRLGNTGSATEQTL